VLVPTGFLALLRQSRGPLVAVAIGIVLLQTLIAGLTSAQATALSASDPFASAICHGAGGAEAPPPPESGHAACCTSCTAAAPALLPDPPLAAARHTHARDGDRSAFAHDVVLIARRAVRAGVSQAPPALD
jgi:hypothetical protein